MAALDPTEYTIPELEDELDDVDDPDALQEALEAERSAEDRKGAIEAIERELGDETADELEESGDGTADAATDSNDGEGASEETSGEADAAEADDLTGSGDDPGLLDIKRLTKTVATDLIESPLDGVVEVRYEDDEWLSVVEVVERRAVPDTQDIIGRYEVRFDDDGTARGYNRVRRFRRSETGGEL